MKNFVKGMIKYGEGFECSRENISRLSDAELKEGNFIGPQIN